MVSLYNRAVGFVTHLIGLVIARPECAACLVLGIFIGIIADNLYDYGVWTTEEHVGTVTSKLGEIRSSLATRVWEAFKGACVRIRDLVFGATGRDTTTTSSSSYDDSSESAPPTTPTGQETSRRVPDRSTSERPRARQRRVQDEFAAAIAR